MLNKLQINSLVTSILLLPAIVLNAYKIETRPLDFIVNNSSSYPVWELYVSSNQTDNWEGDVLVEDILPDRQLWSR